MIGQNEKRKTTSQKESPTTSDFARRRDENWNARSSGTSLLGFHDLFFVYETPNLPIVVAEPNDRMVQRRHMGFLSPSCCDVCVILVLS